MTRWGGCLVALVLLTSCGAGDTSPVVPGSAVSIPAPGRPLVYVAVGASETVGVGADIDRYRNAWPTRFYTTALSRSSVAYNFGIGGETTAAALRDELPQTLALHPTVVTVWLNVDDLVALVPAESYERDLRTLVHALRQGGTATVLVANMPRIEHLPQVQACLIGAVPSQLQASCPQTLVERAFTEEVVVQQEADYNAAVTDAFALCPPGPPPRLRGTGGWLAWQRDTYNLARRFRDEQDQILRVLTNTAVPFTNYADVRVMPRRAPVGWRGGVWGGLSSA